jgi:Glutaredoxin.
MVKIEVFSSRACANCAAAIEDLRAVAETVGKGKIAWREVDVLKEMDYAVDLGVLGVPAIVIDGKLAFSSLPSRKKLRTVLSKHLDQPEGVRDGY